MQRKIRKIKHIRKHKKNHKNVRTLSIRKLNQVIQKYIHGSLGRQYALQIWQRIYEECEK